MAATRQITSPPYTGPSADALDTARAANICIAAAYYADRESTLDLAAAATATPDDIATYDIARLGAVVCDLDTLVVARDCDIAADRHTHAALLADMQRQLDAAVSIRAAAHAELNEARDQLLVQAHTIEQLKLDLALADDLRTAALADAADHQRRSIALSAENLQLRIQAGLNTACLTITGHSYSDLAAEHRAADRAERRAARRAESERQCAAAIGAIAEYERRFPVHERFTDVLELRVTRLARGSQVSAYDLDDETVVVSTEVLA
jgi:hypothetical protein